MVQSKIKKENDTIEKEILKIQFQCIDFWNRPIFKIEDRNLYMSDVNNLFDAGTTKKQIQEFYRGKNLRDMITIHGVNIEDDPLGIRVKSNYELRII